MYKVSIIGHFAFGKDDSNGQTIKTKNIAQSLINIYGDKKVYLSDSYGGIFFLLRLPFILIKLLSKSLNIIILPAQKGIFVIAPLLLILNTFYKRKLHYVVIGGWLPDFVTKYRLLASILRKYYKIYVETNSMKIALEGRHFSNIVEMPNFKFLETNEGHSISQINIPLRVCTFSRVRENKGIADAIIAVRKCNKLLGKIVFKLDIYGKIEEKDWFENLMKGQPNYIRYKGVAPFDKSISILKNYFALLFPTKYKGEGFPGTIIDALSAGIPVIASENCSTKEILENGKTGFLFPVGNVDALKDILLKLYDNPNQVEGMRENCLKEAKRYTPETVIKKLTQYL